MLKVIQYKNHSIFTYMIPIKCLNDLEQFRSPQTLLRSPCEFYHSAFLGNVRHNVI